MNLIIDEGNTRIKLAIFDQDQLVDLELTDVGSFKKDIDFLIRKHPIKSAVLSSVTDEILDFFDELVLFNKVLLSNKTSLPFKNLYKTPDTLGVDRLALATAAYQKYKKQNVLVIDAGTCITYDFINNKGEYLGGAISPGLQMRFNGMSHFTQKLPQLTLNKSFFKLIGESTEASMMSGVFNGIVFEIEGTIKSYQHKFKNVNVILTGGDANFLCKPLKNSIFVNPNFLLEGLNEVLTYQLKHETKFK